MQDDVESFHRKLLDAWNKKNMTEVKHCLDQLQVRMHGGGAKLPANKMTVFTILKDFYEIRALYDVTQNDMDNFEQSIKDVHQFYESSALNEERGSQQQYLMYGLYLMYLLATNKLSEFRMLIERIDRSIRLSDPFLDVPVKLERFLTEGAYNKMTLTEKNLPSPFYKPFVNVLKQAIQNEIAIGLEKAYRCINITDAKKQLFIESDAEAKAVGTKRGWLLKGNSFLIGAGTGENKEAKTTKLALASGAERDLQPLDSHRIINQCLHYAIQIERII